MAAAETEVDAALETIGSQGYCVLEDVIDDDLSEAILEALVRVEQERGVRPADNDFEGRATTRVYNLLAYGDPFAQIPLHPAVLPIVEGVLGPDCLVSSLSSITIGPGETAQPVHADDQVIGMPRPHPAVVCNTMWALTDFTEENGATRIVPSSHRSEHAPEYGKPVDTIPAVMRKGSVLVWHGSLWHGGGANRSTGKRVGIAMNYCAGFIRQQENQQLGVPRPVAATYPKKLQRMLGYGVFRSLIGHIDKSDPIGLLGEDPSLRVIWDD